MSLSNKPRQAAEGQDIQAARGGGVEMGLTQFRKPDKVDWVVFCSNLVIYFIVPMEEILTAVKGDDMGLPEFQFI